jgi:hypothetical protein
MKIQFALLLSLLPACGVYGSVDEPPSCFSSTIEPVGVEGGLPIFDGGAPSETLTLSANFDFSGIASALKDVSKSQTIRVTSITLETQTLSEPMRWLEDATATVSSQDGNQDDLLGTYTAPVGGAGYTADFAVDANTPIQTLITHPVTLDLAITGTAAPPNEALNVTMCVSFDGTISKKL